MCLSIMWWLFTSYSFIDASTPEGYEEEEYYPEAEEEGFDQYPNQGKLLLLARLYQSQVLLYFVLSKFFLIVNFGLK